MSAPEFATHAPATSKRFDLEGAKPGMGDREHSVHPWEGVSGKSQVIKPTRLVGPSAECGSVEMLQICRRLSRKPVIRKRNNRFFRILQTGGLGRLCRQEGV